MSRARELDRDPLDLGRDPVQGLAQPEVGAQRVIAAGFTDLGRELLGVFGVVRLLADQLVDLLVGDLDAELVGRASSTISRARERRASSSMSAWISWGERLLSCR